MRVWLQSTGRSVLGNRQASCPAQAARLPHVAPATDATYPVVVQASQAWQLDAARFRLNNPRWQEVVDTGV